MKHSADLHARLQQGAEGLRQHCGQPARNQAVGLWTALGLCQRGIEGHHGIQAKQQVDVVIQRHRRVHRPAQRAIHEITRADVHRRVQPGEGRA